MILDVNADGVVIPKDWLGDAKQVEVRRENDHLIVAPLGPAGAALGYGEWVPSPGVDQKRVSIFDPVHGLGANPIRLGISDASINLDRYLSDDPHGERS